MAWGLFARESRSSFGKIVGCRNFLPFSPGFISTTVLFNEPYSCPLFKISLTRGVRIYVPAKLFEPLLKLLSLKSDISKVANVIFQFLDSNLIVFSRWFLGVHNYIPYCVLFVFVATIRRGPGPPHSGGF